MLTAWIDLTLSLSIYIYIYLSIATSLGKSSKTVPSVLTELLSVSFCLSAKTGVYLSRSPLENVTNEFVLTSPVVPRMYYLSYLHGSRDGNQMALQQQFLSATSRIYSKRHLGYLYCSPVLIKVV